jgi:SAM-dependent methyltransferase
MRNYYNKLRQAQEFNPTKLGMLMNSCYLIRRTISQAIRENSSNLRGKVLDYGCGSRPYEHFFKDSEYIGVDIETSGHPSERKCADYYFNGTDLPFKNDEFNGVLASEVFEHVFNLQICLKEINRVLKPGGKLLITCPFVWPLHEEPYDFARYTPYAIRQELEAAGFKITKIEQLGTPIEVIIQLWVIEILPVLTRPFRWFRRLEQIINLLLLGFSNFTACLLSKFYSTPSKTYLTNLVIVEKI